MNPVGLLVLIAAALWLAIEASPWRRRRRQRMKQRRAFEQARQQEATDRWLAQQWLDALAYCHSHAHRTPFLRVGLAHVTFVYGSYARRGTKAEIRWYGGNGAPQDTWFELAWPRLGDWLVIVGGAGYGPHNHNPETFYARIVTVVPAGAWEAWQRQQRQPVAG